MARLILLFLGQFQISTDARELDLGYNKVRALLAYLAIESHQAHSRDELAALLWPEVPETTARKNLRQALSTLRAAIGDEAAQPAYLWVTRQAIQFNPSSEYYLDAAEFAELIGRTSYHPHPSLDTCPVCRPLLAQAAELYRGDLLKNLVLPDSLVFEEWLLLTREKLRLQMIELLSSLVAGCEQEGDDEHAMQYSRRLLVLDSWNEDSYRSLMRILARRGQRTAALAEFERCRRLLSDELGIIPSAETLALYEKIRTETQLSANRNPGAAPSSTPARLALPLTALIGREQETASLLELLGRDHIRLVTLMGSPGIGKTRLAMQVANSLSEAYAGNVAFISLTSISNAALAIPAIASSLGLSESSGLTSFSQLVNELKQRKTLLVLDNFEQLVEAGSSLLELLQACPDLKILVTARTSLHLRGEQHFLLLPLALPDPACPPTPESCSENPAVQLFIERVQSVQPEFVLSEKNAGIIASICRRLDGLPLAIELAAAVIRLMSPQQLLEKLSVSSGSALQILREQVRDGAPHHQTLRQAFQWSYDLLTPAAGQLFARLGVFTGGWAPEAADAICNTGDILPDSEAGLAELLDNCLVQKEEDSQGDYRFTMLSTLHDFALDRLSAVGDQELFFQRHSDYFLTFARLAEPELTGRQQMSWLERIEKDLPNFRSALDRTLQHSPDQALQLAVALFPFWHIRSLFNEGRSSLERALAINPAPSPLRARGLAAAGLIAQRQGDFGPALQFVQESVRLSEELEDQHSLAYALNNLAIVQLSVDENLHARQSATQSLAISEQLAFPLGIARAQMILGQLALNEDHFSEAVRWLETSLRFWRESGDQKNAILCLINLGRVQIAIGNFLAAQGLIEESLRLTRRVKDQHWEMVALWNLAEIHLRRGNPLLANPLLGSSLEIANRLGDRYFEAITLNRLALADLYQADFTTAALRLETGLELGYQIGSKWVQADTLAVMACAALLQGQDLQARQYLIESLVIFNKLGENSRVVVILGRLALVLFRQGQLQPAAWIQAFLESCTTQDSEPVPPALRAAQAAAQLQVKAKLGPQIWSQFGLETRQLSLEQAAFYVLQLE